MTKGEFTSLQLQYHQSGKSLKQFLSDTGICYSNYHYWDKKNKTFDTPKELAPILFMYIFRPIPVHFPRHLQASLEE